ncbi:MAG: hypothetical protein ACK40S_03520 [Burkholderiaceae bacterium]
MTKTVTIHLVPGPAGSVTALTTLGTPHPRVPTTTAEALGHAMLAEMGHALSDVRYWHAQDQALALVRDLINPEAFGYSVSAEVHAAARRVLGVQGITGHYPAAVTADEGATS